MKQEEAEEIIASLGQERTLFHYFKDRYACLLLADYIGEAASVRAIKASPFAHLLNRPALQNILQRAGGGVLRRDKILSHWPQQYESYRLTLGIWGPQHGFRWCRSFHQTARAGVNLVLQLNFSSHHDQSYNRLNKYDGHRPFSSAGHPKARRGYRTLAWSRMDIDMAAGEVLIEEVQNDWLRNAIQKLSEFRFHETNPAITLSLEQLEYGKKLGEYVSGALAIHEAIWCEAMLSATLCFIRQDLGINQIYYYDFETGCRLKELRHGAHPPKSLYTVLPKKFGFQRNSDQPAFLTKGASRYWRKTLAREDTMFWKLPVGDSQTA